ncbi:AbrB/MazE/SpoVT family DNA-binding domain-containing protein [Lichenibacterium ramalinae]|uniref:AbrB/MazE/SpoVT family DNA-binding domain-containing protein n=1 Tax=Lichenibacterium ramalinae TaxID=2316527 RepID=A0A4Q2RFL2_9HYPH|nr:AbrB/MazE/SpoVT family DNA-binding domain-containing protein [Lichenibacterium ramalinae]RYB06059.1 AbrB/MazE/SpoVT family DNA-binding domain-containing protein [Lichenibacterium ramalinae]
MTSRAVKIVDGGTLVIPAILRRELGITVGDTVLVEIVDGELRVRPRKMDLKNARRILRQLVPQDVSLVDELIADRRAESARD